MLPHQKTHTLWVNKPATITATATTHEADLFHVMLQSQLALYGQIFLPLFFNAFPLPLPGIDSFNARPFSCMFFQLSPVLFHTRVLNYFQLLSAVHSPLTLITPMALETSN
jgi:hypothetical protein